MLMMHDFIIVGNEEAEAKINDLLDRDKAKLVLDADRNFSYCPNCESGVSIGFGNEIFIYQFCPNCGQRLKWSENE